MARTNRPADPRGLTRKGLATRQRILDATADLVSARGVVAFTLEQVMRDAGVAASQIYYYFGSRDALLRAVIGYHSRASIRAQRPAIDHLDSLEAFEAWRDQLVAQFAIDSQRSDHGIGTLAAQLQQSHPSLRPDLQVAFAQWERAISRGIAAMREKGELHTSADVEQLTTAVLASIQGGLLLAQTRGDPKPLHAALTGTILMLRASSTRRY